MGTNEYALGNGQKLSADDIAYIDDVITKLQDAKKEVGRAYLGQDRLVEGVIWALMAGGNALLTGVPGTGKTALAESIGQVFGLSVKRVQGTPDTMPGDIIGTEFMVKDPETGIPDFQFKQGPVFTNLLINDEINRASPRTQAATLQAMQEKKVTVAGVTHYVPEPHHHLATQNPIDQEGTNPLPEAQKDRFIVEFIVGYPDRDSEREIMLKTTSTQYTVADLRDKAKKLGAPVNLVVSPKDLNQVMEADDLIRIQHLVRMIPLGTKVSEAILDVVRNARPGFNEELKKTNLSEIFNFVSENVEYGPGTRALQAFALMTRAKALVRGDLTPTVDDVMELAEPILRHRIGPSPHARTNIEVAPSEDALRTAIIGKIVDAHKPR